MLEDAASRFNWTSNFVIYAFGSLDNMKYVNDIDTWENDYTVRFDPGGTLPIGNVPDCNCKWGWCPGSDCGEKTCEETTFGCGFLFLGACTGVCD